MNMKKIISFFIVACCAMCATAAKVVWQIDKENSLLVVSNES